MNALAPLRLATNAPAAGPTVEIAAGPAAFERLEPEWTALFDDAKPHQVFQGFAFLSAWASAYAGNRAGIAVVAVRERGRLAAVAPLMRRRRGGLDMLQFMGAPVAQFDDVLIGRESSPDVPAALWAGIEGLGADLLQARRIRADSALQRFRAPDALVFERLQAPFADLPERVDDDQPGPAYSSKERSNFRRRLRRLTERGDVSFRTVEPGSVAAELAVGAIDMKTASLRRQGLYAGTVGSASFRAFFQHVAQDPASGLLVSTIDMDGTPIGIDLSFLCKGVGFGHVLATDGAFEKEGLGQLLVHHVFAGMKQRGAGRFDLLAPADAYKMNHADGVTGVESRAYAFTARGRLAARLGYGLALPVARRIVQRLPGWTGGRRAG